jgi:protein tyrosine/serine phosphatase
MNIRLRTWTLTLAACCAIGAISSASSLAQIGRTGNPAKSIQVAGVTNGASITPTLFRGAQPTPEGIAGLHKLGIDIVVDFRDEPSEIKLEKKSVESQGMRFVSVPWRGDALPTNDELVTFFKLLHDNPDKKIFIHCEYGKDRTGVMAALYRIAVEHWSADQSISEMREFHYNSARLPHLARYVRAFPAMLDANASLAKVIPAPPISAPPVQPAKQFDGGPDQENRL